MKEMAKLGITLMIICAVAGLGLAAVYAKTAPVIEQRAVEDTLKAVKAAVPGAEEIVEEKTEDGETYWLGKKGGETVGGAVKVSSPGFRNPIELMVGFDTEGKIANVAILSLSDTPGIGSRVNDPQFLAKFVGAENPNKVDGISGATISSSGVKGGVGKAVDILGPVLGSQETAAPIDLASVPDGTYQGKGEGLMGSIEVSVTVAGGKITEVKILNHSETAGVADPAISGIPKAMVSENKIDVDAVSGATFASDGIIAAVKDALKQFAGQTGEGASAGAVDVAKIADGTYNGTGEGLMGSIEVSVTVAGGKITEVKVLSNSETAGVADPALTGVPKAIVEKQSAEVDAVSGATFTSKGIIEAVKKALAGAPAK